ncbi:MAG: hypothetical protein ABL931_01420 [Usitatibacteraceae bacterium]
MGRIIELFLEILFEINTWQENTRARRSDDPVTAHWRMLHRRVGVCLLSAVYCYAGGLALWCVFPENPALYVVGILPLFAFTVKAALIASLCFGSVTAWFAVQIAYFDRWPHDFDD